MNSFYFDKMHMLYIFIYIKINHVWSREKNIALKKIVFPKNPLFY